MYQSNRSLNLWQYTAEGILVRLSVVGSELVSWPENAVVVGKGRTVLDCRSNTDCPIRWEKKEDESQKRIIYSGFDFGKGLNNSFYSIVKDSPGQYSLSVDVGWHTAGLYTCILPGTLEKASAELIFLG